MTTLSKLFQKLCGKITILLLSLLIELIILIWRRTSHHTPPFTTREFLKCVEQRNPTIFYTKNLKDQHDHECTVCLLGLEQGQKVRSLKCKHMFHKDCLDKWLQLQEFMPTCPLCRKQVLPDDVVFKHRQMKNQQQEGFDEEQLPYILLAFRDGNTSHLPRHL